MEIEPEPASEVAKGYIIPPAVLESLRVTTQNSVIYGLTSNVHGERYSKTKKWRTHGRNPLCHDAAMGEVNRYTGEIIEVGCGYSCCEVKPGAQNTIAVGPGEWQTGLSRKHLQLVGEEGSYHDGSRVSCLTGTCNPEIDAKFRDCKWYPFFSVIKANRLQLLVGSKCPMTDIARKLQLALMLEDLGITLKEEPKWVDFLRRAYEGMHGYEAFDYSFLEDETEEKLKDDADDRIERNLHREAIRVLSDSRCSDFSLEQMQDIVERYAIDMRLFRDQALAVFRKMKALPFNYKEGLSIEDLMLLAND